MQAGAPATLMLAGANPNGLTRRLGLAALGWEVFHFGPPLRRGCSEYRLCQVRRSHRFLRRAKNLAVATRWLIGLDPGRS